MKLSCCVFCENQVFQPFLHNFMSRLAQFPAADVSPPSDK